MGTPHFISCEQAKNAKEADLRSDIYSLGATLFYMVTSEYPVKGTTAYEVLAALISGQVAKPNIVNPLIPEALNQLILNMMGLAVEDRYQNYEELLSDIDLFLKGSKIKPLIRDQHQATKYIIAKKNIIVGATLLILISIIIFLYSFKPIKETVVKIENNESKISVNELEEFNDQIADNTKKEVFKYSILDSFDREYKRETSLESSLDSKLELLLSWLSLKEIDAENGSKDEKLQAKAFTILAFCGAGYDYYKGPELKKMEAYLRYIINSQNEGKWSEDMWVNVLCANSIIESFAMHGSDNQELAELSLKALSQLEIQSKDTSLKSIDKSILGAHLYILAIKFSRIVRLPKLNKLTPKQFKFIGEIISTFSDSKKENKISFLEQLDHEAVAQLFGKIGETNTFLKELEEKKYVPVSCREAYFFMFFYGIASNKKENKWLFDNAVKFLNTKEIFDNEIKELSDKNGEIITNAIAALAIENIYRIPRDIIPKKRGDILKKIRNR